MIETRVAPPGFTDETWNTFYQDGFVVLPNRLPEDEVVNLRNLIKSYAKAQDGRQSLDLRHLVEMHPKFARMINHDNYIGFVYDVYGEGLKLLLSQAFIRPPGQLIRNDWHYDGPREVPFQVFAPKLPLRIKVGIWLNDLYTNNMGNLIVIRGSHRDPYLAQYKTQNTHPKEEAVCVPAGAITLMAAGLWHRVDENHSSQERVNMFYEYGPSWIVASDRWRCNPTWLETLSREQRIIMRDYEYPNSLIKPPEEDSPLFLPRSGEVQVGYYYEEHVPHSLRKKLTWVERRGI